MPTLCSTRISDPAKSCEIRSRSGVEQTLEDMIDCDRGLGASFVSI